MTFTSRTFHQQLYEIYLKAHVQNDNCVLLASDQKQEAVKALALRGSDSPDQVFFYQFIMDFFVCFVVFVCLDDKTKQTESSLTFLYILN